MKQLAESNNHLDPIKGQVLSRTLQEDKEAVALQWAKTFIYNPFNDPATRMMKLLMATVARGNFQTKTYLSKTLENPSTHLSVVDYLSHASRIIICYKELSEEYRAELLSYFDIDQPGVFSRSATHAVRRFNNLIIEDKGIFLGIKGQAPSYLNTPCDFGVNIAMGGFGQKNYYGRTIACNGYSGHVYFHRNDHDALLMCGLEQSAPTASFFELFSYSNHEHDNNEQQSVDQFGQGHSLVGASDAFTAAGSLYFSDPLYQAKLLAECHILPPDKYGAMQVTLNDQNWGAVKSYLEALETQEFNALRTKLLEPPISAGHVASKPFSYIHLDFAQYLKQCFAIYIEPSPLPAAKKGEILQKHLELLECIRALQAGTSNKASQLVKIIHELKDKSFPDGYTLLIERIHVLLNFEFQTKEKDIETILEFEKTKHEIFLADLFQNLQIDLRDIFKKVLKVKEFYTSPSIRPSRFVQQFLDDLEPKIVQLERVINPGRISDSLTGSWIVPSQYDEATIRELKELLDSTQSLLDHSPMLASESFFIDCLAEERFKNNSEKKGIEEEIQRLRGQVAQERAISQELRHENDRLKTEKLKPSQPTKPNDEVMSPLKAPEPKLASATVPLPHISTNSVGVFSDSEHLLAQPVKTTAHLSSAIFQDDSKLFSKAEDVSSSKSLSLIQWFSLLCFHPSMTNYKADEIPDSVSRIKFDNLFKSVFFETYGTDGIDTTSKNITAAKQSSDGRNSGVFTPTSLTVGLATATFVGLPSRPDYYESRSLSWLQLGRNFIGGWQPLFDWSKGVTQPKFIAGKRALWQIPLLIFVKIPIILPLKVLSIPFKLALNCVKLFTEALPSLLTNTSGLFIRYLHDEVKKTTNPAKLLLADFATLIFICIHYASRLFFLLGTTMTSPEKSAKRAFAFGCSVNVGNNKAGSIVSKILGIVCGALSMAFTISFYAIIFPLFILKIIGLFPALLPFFSSLTQIPVITSGFTLVKGMLTTLSLKLVSTLAPISLALGSYLSLEITAAVLAMSLIISSIAAPVISIASRLADEFSNYWAKRMASIAGANSCSENILRTEDQPFQTAADLVEDSEDLLRVASSSAINVGSKGSRAERGDGDSLHVDKGFSNKISVGTANILTSNSSSR